MVNEGLAQMTEAAHDVVSGAQKQDRVPAHEDTLKHGVGTRDGQQDGHQLRRADN